MLRRFRAGVPGALLVLLAMLCGCTGMVEDELAETHAKLKALQELVASVNKDLTTLDLIVSKLDDSHTIEPGSLKETEDGYEISFRDGKKIFIPYGKDGKDGRTLIPIGVRSDEDSLYYWTVDGEWYLDAEGNKMRAGATDGTDGTDGIAPQVKVEDGFWWISHDGGQSFEKLASCDEMDGVGVFSDIDVSNPAKIILTLLDGTVLEIPRYQLVKVSFSGPLMDTVLIAAGELLPIPYEASVEGGSGEPLVVTSGTDGIYFSSIVEGTQPGQGMVMVQAPEVFSEGYIILSAYCEGYSAVKMISFEERKITPAADTVTVRLNSGSDTLKVAYSANFEYEISCDSTWVNVVSELADTLTFMSIPNPTDSVRTCTVKVSPKDNPDFVCTTFVVIQATEAVTTVSYELDKESAEGFSLEYTDLDRLTLNAPAAGGKAIIWITSRFSVEVTGTPPEWLSVVAEGEGFHKIVVEVKANEEAARDFDITFKIGNIAAVLKVKQQEGKAPETGE